MVVDLVLNAIFLLVSLALVFGLIYLMAVKPGVGSVIFWLIAFPFALFWTWGGLVISNEFGAAGYPMLVVGAALLFMLTIAFIDQVIRPALRRRNSN